MTSRLIGVACNVALLLALSGPIKAAPCADPSIGSSAAEMFSPPVNSVVVGTGRLQFYSAPSTRCIVKGIFVIPDDQLVTYGETKDGWSSVMYVDPRTGDNVSGWVRSNRLKMTGTLGPKQ